MRALLRALSTGQNPGSQPGNSWEEPPEAALPGHQWGMTGLS